MNNKSQIIVKLSNILHNYKQIENYSSKTILQIVKSNAYNLGSIEISRYLQDNGCEWLCVENLDAGCRLRHSGIKIGILVLESIEETLVPIAIQNGLSVTVYDLNEIINYNNLSRGHKLKCHLCIDTGMHRLGAMPNEIITLKNKTTKVVKYYSDDCALELAEALSQSQNLIYEGTWTHFQRSDETDKYNYSYNLSQIEIFNDILKKMKRKGINPGLAHMANSYGIINYRQELNHLDGVRPGLFVLLGSDAQNVLNLKSTFEWKTKVIMVKTYPKNTPISYNGLYVTPERQTIAVIPVGYSHGFRRLTKNPTRVLVGGR